MFVVREALKKLTPRQLCGLVEAVLIADTHFKQTIGDDWLGWSSAVNLPHDLGSIMTGKYVPDENGKLEVVG
jgi:hypothetical protein